MNSILSSECETCKNFSVNFKEYVAYAAKELISGNTDYESWLHGLLSSYSRF